MLNLLLIFSLIIEPFKIQSPEEIYRIAQEKQGIKLHAVYPAEEDPQDPSYVWLGYTPTELVVYVKNIQKSVNASERRRDSGRIENDDSVAITLDTTGRGNEAYTFIVNAIGTQGDGIKTPTGNLEWDGDWRAHAKINKDGWEVIFIIPFKTITFSEQNWGIDIIKLRPGEMRFHRLVNSNDFHSLAGNLIDLKLDFSYVKAKKREYSLAVIPSLRLEREVESSKKYKSSAGITIRSKKGTADLLDFTIKPDFSEVDVDIQEVSYDRLPIDYSEKRPFFIEGIELLSSPFPLIRTRNISLPSHGIKFYKKEGNLSFSTLYLKDIDFKDVMWGRFTYTPLKNLVLGTFYSGSKIGYNTGSFDLTYTFKPLNSVLVFEGARRFDSLSSYYNLDFSRIVFTGLSLKFSFEDIDKNFKNPLNDVYFNFDNVRKFEIISVLSQPIFEKSGNFILKPGLSYSCYRKKDKKETLYESFLTDLMLIHSSLTLNIGYTTNLLNYLDIETNDRTTKTLFLYLGYQKSSSKYASFFYSQGKYLGGKSKAVSIHFFWPIASLNLGMKYDFFKTLYDDLQLFQF